MKTYSRPVLLVVMILVTSCGDDNGAKPAVDSTPPAAIHDLVATSPADSTILLIWTASGDDGTAGQAAQYDVRYSTDVITEQNWTSATAVTSPPAPKSAGQAESLSVAGFGEGDWYVALKAADEAPNWSALSNLASTSLEDRVPPARVTDLTISSSTAHSVTLSWTAPGDDEAAGRAAEYDLRHARIAITEQTWATASPVPDLPAPGAAGAVESWTVGELELGRSHYFALRTTDEARNESALSNVASAVPGLRRLTTSPASQVGAISPDWSPDGGSILFSADWAGNSEIYTVPANGGMPVRLTEHPFGDREPDWSPDGGRIAFTSQYSQEVPQIWIMDALPGSQRAQLASHTNGADGCDWSPDGTRIAYSVGGPVVYPDPPTSAVYVIPSAGGSPELLVDHPSQNIQPAWSPDGSEVAFSSDRGGTFDIWIVPVAGGEARQLTLPQGFDVAPCWSPDGTRIAFASDRTANSEIWITSTSGESATALTWDPAADFSPAWSPDGHRIAFCSTRTGKCEIWIQELE